MSQLLNIALCLVKSTQTDYPPLGYQRESGTGSSSALDALLQAKNHESFPSYTTVCVTA